MSLDASNHIAGVGFFAEDDEYSVFFPGDTFHRVLQGPATVLPGYAEQVAEVVAYMYTDRCRFIAGYIAVSQGEVQVAFNVVLVSM